MDIRLFIGIMVEIALTAFILWLIPRKNWMLFCETVDHFPENVRRLAAWHQRRALRALGRIQSAAFNAWAFVRR